MAFDTLSATGESDNHAPIGNFAETVANHVRFSPNEFVETIRHARPGELAYWYQNLWSAGLDHERVVEIEDFCEKAALQLQADEMLHRVQALPTMLKVHALSYVSPGIVDLYLHDIDRTLQSHFDRSHDKYPSLVIEIIFQNAVASLVRDHDAWLGAEFSLQMVEIARKIVLEFSSGKVRWFHPALAAWQFLLAYRNAISEREDNQHNRKVCTVLEELENQSDIRQSRWLVEFANIYREHRSHQQTLPQILELFIGQAKPHIFPASVSDLVLKARLEFGYLGEGYSAKEMPPGHRPAAGFSSTAEQTSSLLQEFGLRKEILSSLLSSCETSARSEIGLTRGAVEFWRQQIDSWSTDVIHLSEERRRRNAIRITEWLLFKDNSPESVVARLVRKGVDLVNINDKLKHGDVLRNLLDLSFSGALRLARRIQQRAGVELPDVSRATLIEAVEGSPDLAVAKTEYELLADQFSRETSIVIKQHGARVPGSLDSGSHTTPLQEESMSDEPQSAAPYKPIAPGTYTKETLPPISPAAAKVMQEVDELAQWYRERDKAKHRPSRSLKAIAIPLTKAGLVSIRMADPKDTKRK